jgi:16S rRNA processing protein RimM
MNQQDSFLCIGKIVAVHGVKGDLKLCSFTEDPSDLFNYGPYYKSDGSPIDIRLKRHLKKNLFIINVNHIIDRNEAESLKHIDIFIEKAKLPQKEVGEYYHHIIEGSTIMVDNKKIGIVSSVQDFGAGTFLEIQCDDRSLATLPFSDDAIISIDQEQKIIVVNKNYVIQ